jgi:hypothetical protein
VPAHSARRTGHVELGFDLGTPGRELPTYLERDAADLRDTALDRFPRDAELLGELGAEDVLVEVRGRGGLPVQGSSS